VNSMGVTETQVAVAAEPAEYPVVRVEARRGWLALDLWELWAYRNLVYFLYGGTASTQATSNRGGLGSSAAHHGDALFLACSFGKFADQRSTRLTQDCDARDRGPIRNFRLKRS
jgi:hypothetical protein